MKEKIIKIGNDYVCQDCNERSGCSLLPSGCVFLQEFVELIEALIEQEQQKHNTIRWYTAKKHYDEGTETQEDRDILSGAIDTLDCQECMKQAKDFAWEAGLKCGIEAERGKQQPMVEALILSRKHIGHLLQNPDKYKKTGETHEVLAKIDAVLGGSHE